MENTSSNVLSSFEMEESSAKIMECWLNFLNGAKQPNEEIEKVLDNVTEVLRDLSTQGVFMNEQFEVDGENFFFSSFAPGLIKWILDDTNGNYCRSLKEKQKEILLFFLGEFISNIHNSKLSMLYDSFLKIFSEDEHFHKNFDKKDLYEAFYENYYHLFNPDGYNWKRGLKVGSVIDYLIKDRDSCTSKHFCSNWTRAEILGMNETKKTLQILLLGTGEIVSDVDIFSYRILPFNTMSCDFAWREDIAQGMEFDYLDTTKSWYRSTAMEVKQKFKSVVVDSGSGTVSSELDRITKYVKYGLRVYRDTGLNEDSHKRKYHGWSEGFDEEVSVHDPKLRQANEFSKVITNLSLLVNYPIDCTHFNEHAMHIPFQFKSKRFFVIPKRKDNQVTDIIYTQLLNEFIQDLHGFDIFLDVLKNPNFCITTFTFDLFSTIVNIIYNVHDKLHPTFAVQFINDFWKYSSEILLKFSKTEIRNFKRDKIEEIIKHIKKILGMTYVDIDVNAIFDLFGVNFGINCFRCSTILDKKLLGMKILTETLEDCAKSMQSACALYSEKHLPITGFIQNVLHSDSGEYDIFDYLYGSQSHSQIMKKSPAFIKTLFMARVLTEKDVEKVLKIAQSTTDPETRGMIYKGLISNATHMHIDLSLFLMRKICAMGKTELSMNDIELLIAVNKSIPSHSCKESIPKVTRFMFNMIYTSENPELTEYITREFVEMTKSWSFRDVLIEYVRIILNMLRDEDENFLKSLKLIRQLLQNANSNTTEDSVKLAISLIIFPGNVTATATDTDTDTQQERKIPNEINIIDVILHYMTRYHAVAWELAQNKTLTSDPETLIFSNDTMKNTRSHSEIVTEVITFFNTIINHQKDYILSAEQLNIMFRVFVENPVHSKDSNLFFKWVKDAEEKSVIPEGVLEQIFDQMLKTDSFEFTHYNIGNDLYTCIWNIFLAINKNLGKLGITFETRQDTYTNVTSSGQILISTSYNANRRVETEVKCLIPNPLELEGVNLIWKMLLCVTGDCLQRATENFLKLFVNNTFNADEKGKIRNSLIEKCVSLITSASGEERTLKIVNSLFILSHFIEETEKKGTAGCISHHALLKISLMTLKCSNCISTRYCYGFPIPKDNKTFTIKVYSNTNIWDLKKLIAEKLGLIPDAISIAIASLPDLSNKDNGKTISELKLKEGETITVTKNPLLENIPRLPLLRNGALSEKAQKAFSEIFADFSTNGLMSREQCSQFATIAVDSYETIGPEDKRVKVVFDRYDTDKDNFVAVDGFCQFFLDSILHEKKVTIVWDNLKAFHYRNDLKKLNEPLDDYNSDMDITFMPRYLLSKNQEYFNAIFSLQDEEETIAKEASKLLGAICTNPVIFKDILSLSQNKSNDWGKFIETGNKYKLIYSLQIIESIFEEFEMFEENADSEALESNILDHEDKKLLEPENKIQWIENFLINGGLHHIVNNILLNECIISGDNLKIGINKTIYMHVVTIVKNSLTVLYGARNAEKESQKQNLIQLIRKESNHPDRVLFSDEENEIYSMFNENEEDASSKQKESQAQPMEKRYNEFEQQLFDNLNAANETCVISSINTSAIVSRLMQICLDISMKTEYDGDEKSVMSNSLNLLSLIIISQENPSMFLKDSVYNCTQIKFDSFVLFGSLKSININVRSQFCRTMKSLAESLFKLSECSFSYVLVEICNTKITELVQEERSQCKFFFEFFQGLLGMCLKNNHVPFDVKAFAIEIIKLLTNPASVIEEEVLSGYLKVVAVIFNNVDAVFKTYCGKDLGLISGLIEKYLLKDIENETCVSRMLHDTLTSYTMINPNNPKFQSLDKTSTTSSPDTRSSIYRILFILICNNPENLITFFTSKKVSLISYYISQLKKDKKSYNPFNERRSMNGYLGIKNMACICYMISMIQQFFLVPSFRYAIMQANDQKPPSYSDTNKEIDDNMLHQLQKMFIYLEMSNRGDYAPNEFVFSFKDIDGKPTDYMQQCDAQEFLGRLLDKMEELLKPTKFKYILRSVFAGETCSQLMCQNGCGKVSNRFEDLYSLSLEIRNQRTLKDSLDKYISEETIDDFYCELCKQKTRHVKQISIAQLPNVLVVHLQRIAFNYESLLMEKINTKLEFPKHLNLKSYCTETLDKNKGIIESESKEKINASDEDDFSDRVFAREEEYYDYDLVGVVVHSGTALCGHYYSLINVKRDGCGDSMNYDPEKDYNKWLRFDDSLVSSYNVSKLEDETFGGAEEKSTEKIADFFWEKPKQNEWEDSSRNAYMLIYERIKKTPVQLVDTAPHINETTTPNLIKFNDKNKFKVMKPFNYFGGVRENAFLDCENTAISRQDISNYVFLHEDKDEVSYYVPFYWISCKENIQIPSNYFMDVAVDNLRLLNDEKVFSKSFSLFIEKVSEHIVELITSESISHKNILLIMDILNKILLEIIAKSYHRDNLDKIVNNMNTILESFPEFTDNAIKYFSTFKDRVILDLLFSSEESANKSYKNYLMKNILLNIKLHAAEIKQDIYNHTDVFALIDYFYSLFPNEIAKNWTKMVSFLEIFESLANENDDMILTYMFQHETISKLIDFFLVKESPLYKKGESRTEVGNKTVNGKFAPLISTVATLTRHCATEAFSIDDIVNGNHPPTFIKTQGKVCYSLSETDILCLSCKEFYIKAVGDSYNNEELAKMVSHLMFNNLDFTCKRMYSIIESINEGIGAVEAKKAFDLLEPILGINDKYIQFRIQCIFGIPILNVKVNDSSPPMLVERNSKYFEKIIKYISPLFPNKDCLIERIIHKYKASLDFLTVLTYFFDLIFQSNIIFSYFDSLPHPRTDKALLKYYIYELACEEIERCKSVPIIAKKYERQIATLEKTMEMYETRKEQYAKEGTLLIMKFAPKHKFGNILRENLHVIENDLMKSLNVHAIVANYDVEIIVENQEEYKGVDTVQIELEPSQEIIQKVEETTIEDNNPVYKDEENEKEGDNNDHDNDNDNDVSSNHAHQGEDDDMKKLGFGGNDDEEEKEKDLDLIQNKYSSQEEPVQIGAPKILANTSPDVVAQNLKAEIPGYTTCNEELYLKKNIDTLLLHHTSQNNPLTRTFYTRIKADQGVTKIIVPCIRRYFIVNNSDRDFKATFKFTSADPYLDNNTFIPECDVNVLSRKKSLNTVFTFVKDDLTLPFNETLADISLEEYDASKDMTIFEMYEPLKTKHKRGRSAGDSGKKEINVPPLKIEKEVHEESLEPADRIQRFPSEEGGVELECPSCKTKNKLRDDDVEFKCKFCHSFLLL